MPISLLRCWVVEASPEPEARDENSEQREVEQNPCLASLRYNASKSWIQKAARDGLIRNELLPFCIDMRERTPDTPRNSHRGLPQRCGLTW